MAGLRRASRTSSWSPTTPRSPGSTSTPAPPRSPPARRSPTATARARRASLFHAGTKAEMVLPDGTVKPLDDARRARHRVHRRRLRPGRDARLAAAELRLHVRGRAVRRPGRRRGRDRGPLRQAGRQLRRQLPRLPGRRRRADRLLRPRRRRVEGRPERPRDQAAGRRRRQGPDRHRRRRRRPTTASASTTPSARASPRPATSATSCGASRWTTSRRGTTTGPTRPIPTPCRRRRRSRAPTSRPTARQAECNKKGSIIGCQSQTLAEELAGHRHAASSCATTRAARAAAPTARSRSR